MSLAFTIAVRHVDQAIFTIRSNMADDHFFVVVCVAIHIQFLENLHMLNSGRRVVERDAGGDWTRMISF